MALWRIPSTGFDRVVAREILRHTSPAVERPWKIVTLVADEKLLLGAAAGVWLATRALAPERRREADHLAVTVALTAALPHLLKLVFDQERPDRTIARGRHHGIPRSGKAFDAFPSGHAAHVGAICAALSRFFPSAKLAIWSSGGIVAASRIILLAHWPTDIFAGLATGAATEALLWKVQNAYFRKIAPPERAGAKIRGRGGRSGKRVAAARKRRRDSRSALAA
jgi:membrane-associated phospholipid phosphatase